MSLPLSMDCSNCDTMFVLNCYLLKFEVISLCRVYVSCIQSTCNAFICDSFWLTNGTFWCCLLCCWQKHWSISIVSLVSIWHPQTQSNVGKNMDIKWYSSFYASDKYKIGDGFSCVKYLSKGKFLIIDSKSTTASCLHSKMLTCEEACFRCSWNKKYSIFFERVQNYVSIYSSFTMNELELTLFEATNKYMYILFTNCLAMRDY